MLIATSPPAEMVDNSLSANPWRTPETGALWHPYLISRLGGDHRRGTPYYLAVILADEQASAFFDTNRRKFCAQNHYPGFQTIELPPGLSPKYSTRVIRK